MAALYERNYAKASDQFAVSLQAREGRLAKDQAAVADAAFFLGQSLYEEGKYEESVAAFPGIDQSVSAISSIET